MANTVPCPTPDRCGALVHVIGSESHRQCMARSSSKSSGKTLPAPSSVTAPSTPVEDPEPDTRKSRHSRKSPEERREDAKALHESLTQSIEEMSQSEQWMRYLRTVANFRRYSINNQMLIRIQRPDATRVAGYGVWRKANRQVIKAAKAPGEPGSRGIKIYGAPFTKTETVINEKGEEEVRETHPIFPIRTVFDIADTVVIDPDKPDPMGADLLSNSELRVNEPENILNLANKYADSIGYTIEESDLRSGGYDIPTYGPDKGKILIKSGLSDDERAYQTLRAISQVTLEEDGKTPHDHSADAVAYIVGSFLEMDMKDRVAGTIIEDGKDSKEIKETIYPVLEASTKMMEFIDSYVDMLETGAPEEWAYIFATR